MSKANRQFASAALESGEAAAIPPVIAQCYGFIPAVSRSEAEVAHNFIKDDLSLQFYFERNNPKWNGVAIQVNKKGGGRISGLIKPVSWEDAVAKIAPHVV